MSERISSCYFSEEQQRESAIAIGLEAVNQVDRAYGRGYPLESPGQQELSYHNGHHSRKVGQGAVEICTHLDLPPVAQAIAKAAGNAHDIVQLKGRGVDEEESADWLVGQMEKTRLFPAQLRQMGALAIIGTEPLFEEGRIVGQRATELTYPSQAAEIVAKSVASADMGELYAPEGPYLSHQLFREVSGMPSGEELPFEKVTDFQRDTLDLAESYNYPLAKAEELLATHRSQVIAFHRELLAKLEAGTIESWQELLAFDLAFIEKHRS